MYEPTVDYICFTPIAVIWLCSTPYHLVSPTPYEERLIIIRHTEPQSLYGPTLIRRFHDWKLKMIRNDYLIGNTVPALPILQTGHPPTETTLSLSL